MTVETEALTSTCTLHYRSKVGHAVPLPRNVKLYPRYTLRLKAIGTRVAAELGLTTPVECRVVCGYLGILVPPLVPHEAVRRAAVKVLADYSGKV